jgi:3-hydroxyisobutyrate dehydrogenase
MKIGLCGTGRMGAAIVLRLLEVGHNVTVWNRDMSKTKPLVEAGAKPAATPAADGKATSTPAATKGG